MYRTHTCGQLRLKNVNEKVCLSGWVQKIRNLGAMSFIDLRDRYGITQLVVEESATAEIKDKHILLVDDVVTTGATLLACAEALLKSGNCKISLLTLAITQQNNK